MQQRECLKWWRQAGNVNLTGCLLSIFVTLVLGQFPVTRGVTKRQVSARKWHIISRACPFF